MSDARVSSGVPGLDETIDGGFPPGRTILVRGQIGTGKTTLGLQFLMEGMSRGEPGVMVSVDAKPRHVIEDATRFGWDLQDACARRSLGILDASPYFTAARRNQPLDARQVVSDLAQQVRALKATRMAIDSLSSLLPPDAPPNEVRDFLRSLFFSLEDSLGCTVLLTAWDRRDDSTPGAADAEYLASGVMDLRLVRVGERFVRRLFVRKMRGTSTDLTERTFEIVRNRGLVLDGDGHATEGRRP